MERIAKYVAHDQEPRANSVSQRTVVGLGEILWDILPSGRQLGGAPANFAYCAHLLGNRAIVASRIGEDELGHELRKSLDRCGIANQHLQTDPVHPTGTVHVQVSAQGQPTFNIAQPVAWDFLAWNESWKMLAQSAAAVCFGSLAQRSPVSRQTIASFLQSTRPESLRIFDVNLRQSFYSAEILSSSLEHANIAKLNDEEMPVIGRLLHIPTTDPLLFCKQLLEKFQLRLACVTRGRNGSVLVDKSSIDEHPGFHVSVKDTVGAGDAFTAGLIHELLRGSPLRVANDTANRLGAWVATQTGGMPPSTTFPPVPLPPMRS